jgi:hypothetical protein
VIIHAASAIKCLASLLPPQAAEGGFTRLHEMKGTTLWCRSLHG